MENPAYSENEKRVSQDIIDKLNNQNEELYNSLKIVEPLYDRSSWKEIGKPYFEYKNITSLDEANEMFDEYNFYHSTLGTDMKFLEGKKEYNKMIIDTLEKDRIRIEEIDMIEVMNNLMMQQQQFEAISYTIKIIHELRLTNFL